MEQDALNVLTTVSWPAALAIVAWALRPVWGALANKMKAASSDPRIESLERFQAEAEGNHFTDIVRLLDDTKGIQRDVSDLRERMARIEAKVLNGHAQHNGNTR